MLTFFWYAYVNILRSFLILSAITALILFLIFLLPIYKYCQETKFKELSRRIWLSLDQFGNVLIDGNEDETISSRLGRNEEKCLFCRIFCKLLDKIFKEKDHCKRSIGN